MIQTLSKLRRRHTSSTWCRVYLGNKQTVSHFSANCPVFPLTRNKKPSPVTARLEESSGLLYPTQENRRHDLETKLLVFADYITGYQNQQWVFSNKSEFYHIIYLPFSCFDIYVRGFHRPKIPTGSLSPNLVPWVTPDVSVSAKFIFLPQNLPISIHRKEFSFKMISLATGKLQQVSPIAIILLVECSLE